MPSLPFLGVANGGRAATAALLRMLSRPSPNPNPNHSFFCAMATGTEKSLIPRLPNLSNPNAFPLNPQHLQTSVPKSLHGLRMVPSRSAALAIQSAAEARGLGIEVESSNPSLVVVSFYKFADFPDHATMRQPLKDLCEEVVSRKFSNFSLL